MSSVEEVKRQARTRFAAAADRYVTDRIHVEGEELDRMVALAGLTGRELVLDVATGGGHTALAFARGARRVVALDLTPAMLAAAARYATARGARNVSFLLGDAEALPLGDGRFDVVAARYAPHHFPQPERFVAEAARVLRPGGRVVVFDNMVPEDEELDAFMNRFETWRDPSHFRAHRRSEWAGLMEAAGLAVEAADPLVRKRYVFEEWTAKQSMPAAERDALERWLLDAPARCREFFAVTERDGRVAWLEATFGFVAARAMTPGDALAGDK
jgi:ubiquinone/menaquinone biosynthesis C-methylase UbiE